MSGSDRFRFIFIGSGLDFRVRFICPALRQRGRMTNNLNKLGDDHLVGPRQIGYPDNFKVSGSGSLSGGSIFLLSLSGSVVLGYPGVGYPSKNCNIRGYPDPDLDP